MKRVLISSFYLLIFYSSIFAQNPVVYTLTYYELNDIDTFALLSMSDNYHLSENRDSLAIPDVEEIGKTNAKYIKLDSIFRTRFLDGLKIKENDKVYLYDYSTYKLKFFAVKDLEVAACLNLYGGYWPYSQYEYMIGFIINRKLLNGFDKYYLNTLAFVGKKNPFDVGKLKPVVWKKTPANYFPQAPVEQEMVARLDKGIKGNAYSCNTYGYNCYIQEYNKNDILFARRLLVMKAEEVVCDRIFFDHESASPAPLNNTQSYPDIYQWSGILFRNKPPVIFGFEFVSFGCPVLTLLDKTTSNIYINCDNRH